jgi:hypothetical protein
MIGTNSSRLPTNIFGEINRMSRVYSVSVAYFVVIIALASTDSARADGWTMHTIDDASRGADGVRLADFNKDGLPDVVTGWEQGGEIRLCINPGPAKSKGEWPSVTVGHADDAEDAMPADLDGDGAIDIVSCCEGTTRSVFVHWGPNDPTKILDASQWRTEAFPQLAGKCSWMFSLAMNVDGKNGPDLVIGAKLDGAQLGWLESPANPRELGKWKWHALRDAGWIMSLITSDMDGDGDKDILFSDRRGKNTGVFWLERPNGSNEVTGRWKQHSIGALGREVMFITEADIDHDGLLDVVAAVKPRRILIFKRGDASGTNWTEIPMAIPEHAGTAKSVTVVDMDNDNQNDIVFTCEKAEQGPGVGALLQKASVWDTIDISGPKGVKYDLSELLDLDGDGDLDVLTCEEIELNAVIWYESPLKR